MSKKDANNVRAKSKFCVLCTKKMTIFTYLENGKKMAEKGV